MNADNWLTGKVTPLHQVQPGLTLGGPIVKDKAFFFVGYEYQKAGITKPAHDGQSSARRERRCSANPTSRQHPARRSDQQQPSAVLPDEPLQGIPHLRRSRWTEHRERRRQLPRVQRGWACRRNVGGERSTRQRGTRRDFLFLQGAAGTRADYASQFPVGDLRPGEQQPAVVERTDLPDQRVAHVLPADTPRRAPDESRIPVPAGVLPGRVAEHIVRAVQFLEGPDELLRSEHVSSTDLVPACRWEISITTT